MVIKLWAKWSGSKWLPDTVKELVRKKSKGNETENMLKELQQKAINNENIFEALMDVCKVCSLGQITSALFEVGGQYRRNM